MNSFSERKIRGIVIVVNAAVVLDGYRPLSVENILFRTVTNRFSAQKAADLVEWQVVFGKPWSWKVAHPFQKKQSVISHIHQPFSERKSADLALLEVVFRQRKRLLSRSVTSGFRIKPRLTSGCSPSPTPSPHLRFGSVSCRLNHALCSLQRGLWKLNHCIVTV